MMFLTLRSPLFPIISIPMCTLVNIWGFQRIITGPNKGGYSHKYFIRANESLCCMMSRQKIKGEKRAKPRPYFPFKAMTTCVGRNRGVENLQNLTSIQDQALAIMLGKERFPTNQLYTNGGNEMNYNCRGDTHNNSMPFLSNTPNEAPCPINMSSTATGCNGQVSLSSSFEGNARTISPGTIGSIPSNSNIKRPISPLTFIGNGGSPLLDCDGNDDNMDANLMESLSPDPIAPDHPLSQKFNQAKSSTIDELVQDDCSLF